MKNICLMLLGICCSAPVFALTATNPPDCTLATIAQATATTGNASMATDGNSGTRWESAFADPQTLTLDLGALTNVSAVSIDWETASAKDYFIRGSVDGTTWVDIAEKTNMPYGARTDVIENIEGQYRWIRMDGITRTTQYGYSIWEINVCSTPIEEFVGKHALFIGNSYTFYNDMPVMVENMAASTGDALDTQTSTISGYSLEQHAQNAGTLNKIQEGGWDFVVLQEHSQRPALEYTYVQTHTFPYAEELADMAREYSPCAGVFFYRTWGRENGDSQNCPTWPPVCTYTGMDDLLQERYMEMANNNNAMVSPVGAIWREIRAQYPEIDLYDPDQSHPTLVGSYASACTFYTVLFRKDPTLITYNTTLSATVANQVKAIVKSVVYDNLASWNVGSYDPAAAFSFEAQEGNVTFINASGNATSYLWDFGDSTTTSEEENPGHVYTQSGTYTVTLTAINCGLESTVTQAITLEVAGLENYSTQKLLAYPNPAKTQLTLQLHGQVIAHITVTDVTGKVLLQAVNPGSTLNIEELSPGYYIIKAFCNGTTYTGNFLKQ